MECGPLDGRETGVVLRDLECQVLGEVGLMAGGDAGDKRVTSFSGVIFSFETQQTWTS